MKKIILGHRGYSEIAPENTKLAFNAALLFKFDGVEIDIHKTKDNKLVIIHDETINRTSNGIGRIKNFTLKELQEFNFAYKFNKSIIKQTILTYEEFLKEYGSKFKFINVEIKTNVYHYKNIEQLIWKVDQKIKPKAKIIYSSFHFKSIQIMRKIAPKALLGFLFINKKALVSYEQEVKQICDFIHPFFKTILKPKILDYYKTFNLKINTWTLNWTKPKKQKNNKIINKLKNIKIIFILISNSKI